jgi:hypothetical protein
MPIPLRVPPRTNKHSRCRHLTAAIAWSKHKLHYKLEKFFSYSTNALQDAIAFVESLTVLDIEGLPVGKGSLSLITNDQGKFLRHIEIDARLIVNRN